MPGGRPSKYCPELANAICQNLANGLTEEPACAMVRIHPRTLINWKKREEFLHLRAMVEGTKLIAWLTSFEEAKNFLELKRAA